MFSTFKRHFAFLTLLLITPFLCAPPAEASFVSGRVWHQQVFTASGTFTPSAGLIQAGGYVQVFAVGGGGGGGNGTSTYGGGGGGQVVKNLIVVATTAQTVTIGAGGAVNANGGNTTFGSLVTAQGGFAPTAAQAGNSGNLNPGGLNSGAITGGTFGGAGGGAGGAGQSSQFYYNGAATTATPGMLSPGVDGYGSGGAGKTAVDNGLANSGNGGCQGSAGNNGYLSITWYE